MTQADSPMSEREIKRYLFAETTDEERRQIEQRLFLDDELFYEVINLENELVDRYARKKLDGEDLARFERGLAQIPERRQKVANAVALQTLIAEERPAKTPAIASAGQTFWGKLAGFFTVKTPAFGYAMSGLMILFAVAAVVLLLQNNRQNRELARLQNERQQYEQSPRREGDLQNEIADLRRRESDLQSRIDAERETSGDLTDEIARERQSRRQVESELEKVSRQANVARPQTPPSAPTIATVKLKFGIGARNSDAPQLDVAPTTKRIAVQISLPAETDSDERFSVRLNGKNIASDLKARVAPDGEKSLQIAVAPNDLLDGENKLTVVNQAGATVGEQFLTTFKK